MIEVEVVSSVSGLEPHRLAWSKLFSNALDQNLYFTPQFLIPALRYFGTPGKYRVLFFYSKLGGTRELITMMPIAAKTRSFVLPCKVASSLAYPHCYLCFPVIHKKHVSDSITALKNWLDSQKGFEVLEIVNTYEDSATWRTINDEVKKLGWVSSISDRYTRAMLKRRDSYDDYLQGISKRRRKRLRQTRKALSERGILAVNVYKDIIELPDLANRFMTLEKLGWKGETKSALASSANGKDFFNEVVAAAQPDAELFFTELTLDKIPIAMTANFIVNTDFFAFKVANDPAYAKFSPGIFLEYESIRLMYVDSDFQTADSGSEQDSFVGNIWTEKQEMMILHLARNSLFARMCLLYMRTGKAIKQRLRETKSYFQNLVSR